MDTPTLLVIFGITGDLSRRKLIPAIEQIAKAGALPAHFRLIGVTRRAVSPEEVLKGIDAPYVRSHLTMRQMDLASLADYRQLASGLDDMARDMGVAAQRLFYLSVPPQISRPIVELLGQSGLAKQPRAKLLLEKPFGTDLASAEELVAQTRQYFGESQIYRIDHYLAKEMAQNLIVFRQGNSLFKRTWNKNFIEKIDIVASEKIGIEGRAAFYEQTGALRDLVQSHLLQLAALTLMTTPKGSNLSTVPENRLRALEQLRIDPAKPVFGSVVRGQYAGYRDEVGDQKSNTETFVDLRLQSADPAWEGVPIRLITGKALDAKTTEIRITYKKDEDFEANQLVITFQPDEGVDVYLWTKVPGYSWKMEQHSLHLAFKDHFDALPEAYEQVLVDAMRSSHTLFTSSDEVLASWRIIQPVQEAWEMSADDLVLYEPGSGIDL
ncbi:MAG TPA: glucose-6-phosphate dehydrogenase [Candidatus Saccharimonadales bacterium]|nr:glucose-6-phosphate dehydrogenase [Candidatus Saccharimonadales bacterium]